jgi:hypothetical protein
MTLLFISAIPASALDLSAFDLSNLEFDGRMSSEYRGRWSGEDDDHDLYSTLYLKAKQKEDGPLSATFLGNFNWDMGGGEGSDSAFRGIYDTHDHEFQARLYLLYLDIDDVLLDASKLRLGRQHVFSTDVIRFDGLKYEKRFRDLEVYAFGGTRTSVYSSLYDEGYAAGSGMRFYPFKWTRVGVDYARTDDNDGFGTDSVSVNATQRFCKAFQLSGQSRFLDDDFRDFRLRARLDIEKINASAIGTYFRQVDSLSGYANEFSNFYQVQSDYHPFEQYSIVAHKGLGENYTISGGAERRTVSDSEDVGSYNREFKRYFASFDSSKILNTPLRGNIAFERWETDVRDRVTAIGGEVGMTFWDKLDVDVGTAYSGYKYDLVRESESSNVRTYFGRLRYDLKEWSQLGLRFEREDNEIEHDPFYTLRLRWTVNF